MIFTKKKPITKDAEKDWNFDSAMKACMDKDMSDEEKEEKLKDIKEKMKEKEAKDKSAKDQLKVRDKSKDEEMEDVDPVSDKDLEDLDQEKNDIETTGTSGKDKKAKDKKMTGDSTINIQKIVADSVAKEMEKLTKKTLAFDSAIKEYERIYGRVNRMAFDSAEAVLDTILKNNKRNIDGKSFEQKQAMVEMIEVNTKSSSQHLVLDSISTSKNHTPSNILDFIKKKVG